MPEPLSANDTFYMRATGSIIAIVAIAITDKTNSILMLSQRIPFQIDPIILMTNYLLGIAVV